MEAEESSQDDIMDVSEGGGLIDEAEDEFNDNLRESEFDRDIDHAMNSGSQDIRENGNPLGDPFDEKDSPEIKSDNDIINE